MSELFMEDPTTSTESQGTGSTSANLADVTKIRTLLKAKDDTQRFVGLALLKSVLDSTPELRQDEQSIQGLWESIPAKFLDRLIRTGSKLFKQDAKEMLDLAISVLHTFVALLPTRAGNDVKFLDRIPNLVNATLYSSEETTALILQIFYTLVSTPDGAHAFLKVDDISPITEACTSHPMVLDILGFAWLNAATVIEEPSTLVHQIDDTIQSIVSSFTGTDGVTLLEFLGTFLRNANPVTIPRDPKWLQRVVKYIHNLVASRPTPEARSAYTNAIASLLQTYQHKATKLIFTESTKDGGAISFLLVNLLLIDIRSSAPTLLEKLNSPDYPKTSRRLGSAFDTIAVFLGYLIQSLEDESLETFIMPPDNLLKLRNSISETMSVTIEYLRDRWDASIAGAMGLHSDARAGSTETATGSHYTIAWDSMKDHVDEDMFILSAMRALAIWIREDENDTLRKEATGLMDMFLDLYKSSSQEKLDFRSPVLVALEGLITIKKGRQTFLANDGWQILCRDLVLIFNHNSTSSLEANASRAIDIVRILLPVVEEETGGIPEIWMDFITAVAAIDITNLENPSLPIQEALLAVLQLSCAVLVSANPGMRQRYKHSISAIGGIGAQVSRHVDRDGSFGDILEDVLATLNDLSRNG